MKFVDLTDQKFGRLTVVKLLDRVRTPKGVSQVKYLCRCDCGNEVEVFAGNLRKGNTFSCGCLNKELASKRGLIDLTGKTFGRLTVLSRSDNNVSSAGNMSTMWKCRCSCGNEIIVNGNSLRRARQMSCGCLLKEKISEMFSIDLTNKKFGRLTAIEPINDNGIRKWKCQCECGNVTYVKTAKLRNGWTKSCGCLTSVGEELIIKILCDYDIEFDTQFEFEELKGPNGGVLKFDFALFDSYGSIVALIEYQGKQHFIDDGTIEFGKYQREHTDKLKKDFCEEHWLPLYEIRYDNDINERLSEILTTLYGNLVPSSNKEKV